MAAKPSCYLLLLLLPALFLGFLTSPAGAAQVILPRSTLPAGQSLTEGPYRFTVQDDCNAVLYDNGRAVWSTGTNGRGFNCRLTMQADGNLVLYTGSGAAVWSSGTARGNGNYVLVLQGDRNLVIYGSSIWASGTRVAATGDSRGKEKVVINKP